MMSVFTPLFIAIIQLRIINACFNSSICTGDTPRYNPESYFCITRHSMKERLQNPKYSKYADKLYFKKYCARLGVKTAPTLAIYDQSDYASVDFERFLPSYVIKSNTAAARIIGVRDGLFINGMSYEKATGGLMDDLHKKAAIQTMSLWGGPHYATERQYNRIKPKIFIEKYLDPTPDDIKVYVVHGKPDLIQIVSHHMMNFFDMEMNLLPYVRHLAKHFVRTPSSKALQNNPHLLAKLNDTVMTLVSEIVLPIVRVDVYLIGDEFYGGEITLSPFAGNDFIQHQDRQRHPIEGYENQNSCDIKMDSF